jgi:putative transposase
LRNRKLPRKRNHDYNEHGSYFVTICTKNRVDFFGTIDTRKNYNLSLSDIGKIAEECWNEIPKHFNYVEIDAFVIMPNHVHGIIHLLPTGDPDGNDPEGKGEGKEYILSLRLPRDHSPVIDKMNQRLPVIIRTYKAAVTRLAASKLFAWQTSYHDHIIHNEQELQNIRKYIENNPLNWATDKNKF